MLGTVLIVTPSGTPLRAEARSLALPYFGQSWRVFAPNILKANRDLEIRAQWRDDSGELVRSDWVSITQIELRTVSGNPVPSRIAKSSWNPVGTYLTRYRNLESEQRERVRNTFIESHEGGYRPIPSDELLDELGRSGSTVSFLRMDYMMMRYATLYATAGFGEEIERVQWRIARERPNDFIHRFDEEQQFETPVTTFGWRQSNVRTDQSVINEYSALIDRYGGRPAFEKAAEHASK